MTAPDAEGIAYAIGNEPGSSRMDHSLLNSESNVINIEGSKDFTVIDSVKAEHTNIRSNTTTIKTLVKVGSDHTPGTKPQGLLQRKIEETKSVFVKTDTYRRIHDILKKHGHVTITGAPGEGKTSIALMLGDLYRSYKYQLVFVDKVEKFDLEIEANRNTTIIFDDIFGSVGMTVDVTRLRKLLDDLQLYLPRSDLPLDSRSRVQVLVIFTTKSYNLECARLKLGSQKDYFFSGTTVLDITQKKGCGYSISEKGKMVRIYQKMFKTQTAVDIEHIEQICMPKTTVFGFPLSCSLYFSPSGSHRNAQDFFSNPLDYLSKELGEILGLLNEKSAALILMLLCEDSLDLAQLEMPNDENLKAKLEDLKFIVQGVTPSEIAMATRNFKGSYFIELDEDVIGFAHQAIYDACACALFKINRSFLLAKCSIKFLFERVQSLTVKSSMLDEHLHIIQVSDKYHDTIARRLTVAILDGIYSMSIAHTFLQRENIVDRVFEELDMKLNDTHDTPTKNKHEVLHSREKNKCFLSWAVHSRSLYLIQKILTAGGEFSETEINQAFEECTYVANVPVMKHLMSNYRTMIQLPSVQTALATAAKDGNQEMFDFLLTDETDLTFTDSKGDSLLHFASRCGNVWIAEKLLPAVNINSRGHCKRTPTMVAALCGHGGVFNLLVSRKADIALADEMDLKTFHFACMGGNSIITETLLTPENMEIPCIRGWTPIMAAAFYGKKDVFDLLKSKGADLSKTDDYGNTLLHIACIGGCIPIVEQVMQSCAIDLQNPLTLTPLMNAAFAGKKEILDLLVSKGVNLKLTNELGQTLLHSACEGKDTSVVEYLLPMFDINVRDNHGWTPVMKAAYYGREEIFDLLVSEKADLNLKNDLGQTLFHIACEGGSEFIVKHLQPFSDINGCDGSQVTPLMKVASTGNQAIFYQLLSTGADPKLTNNFGQTALHIACQNGNTSVVKCLLPFLDINDQDNLGWTPVMKAARYAKKEVFDLLVSNEADLTLKTTGGQNLLELACEGGNVSMMEHILMSVDIMSGDDGWTVERKPNHDSKKHFDPHTEEANPISVNPLDHEAVNVALKDGDTSTLDYALAPFDEEYLTSRHIIILKRKKKIFDILQANGVNPKLTEYFGQYLLFSACEFGETSVTDDLLSFIHIDSQNGIGRTPVMIVALGGRKDLFDLLVLKGADLALSDNQGNTTLHLACQVGNEAIVKEVMKLVDINMRDKSGNTPLMKAVSGGHVAVFDLLMSHQADINLVNDNRNSLLHLACVCGNFDMVKHVLPLSYINMKNKQGWTSVMLAVFNGLPTVVQYLVDEGADLTLTDDVGDDLLTLAYRGGYTEIIWQLSSTCMEERRVRKWTMLEKDLVCSRWQPSINIAEGSPELTQTDEFGDSLLHLACRGGNKMWVEYLLPFYDINIQGRHGWTPAMMTAVCGHLDVFQFLLLHHPDLSLLSDTKEDVLSLACRGGNVYIIRELLSFNEFQARDVYMFIDETIDIHSACMTGILETVSSRLSDCNINTPGSRGWTPVMVAAFFGHLSVFRHLLTHQPDLSHISDSEDDVLTLACRGRNVYMINDLISVSDFQSRNLCGFLDGDTSLHLVCMTGNMTHLKKLLPYFEVNVRGRYEWTPVMVAAACGHWDVFLYLLSHGADVSLKSESGLDVLTLARQGRNKFIVKKLLTLSHFNKKKKDNLFELTGFTLSNAWKRVIK